MTYTHKKNQNKGNGWRECFSAFQDFDKAENKQVTVEELKELWVPASGSVISVATDIDGLTFELEVQPKEYHTGGRKRKPTNFAVSYQRDEELVWLPFIPIPTVDPKSIHQGAWHSKLSWSAAVKELTTVILPKYVQAIEENQTLCVWNYSLK